MLWTVSCGFLQKQWLVALRHEICLQKYSRPPHSHCALLVCRALGVTTPDLYLWLNNRGLPSKALAEGRGLDGGWVEVCGGRVQEWSKSRCLLHVTEVSVGKEALTHPDRCSDSSVHLSLCVLNFSSATDSSECATQVSGVVKAPSPGVCC